MKAGKSELKRANGAAARRHCRRHCRWRRADDGDGKEVIAIFQ